MCHERAGCTLRTHTYIDIHGDEREELAVVDEAVGHVVVDKETQRRKLVARLDEVHALLLHHREI